MGRRQSGLTPEGGNDHPGRACPSRQVGVTLSKGETLATIRLLTPSPPQKLSCSRPISYHLVAPVREHSLPLWPTHSSPGHEAW